LAVDIACLLCAKNGHLKTVNLHFLSTKIVKLFSISGFNEIDYFHKTGIYFLITISFLFNSFSKKAKKYLLTSLIVFGRR